MKYADINVIEGQLHLDDVSIGLVTSRFNEFIVKSLVEGAVDALTRSSVSADKIDLVYVPGALELPLVAGKMARSGKYDAVIALGAVIRGATPHFDIVANESAKGLASLALQHEMPVINAIITTNTIEQAIERAGTKAGNKGAEAAIGALEMISVLRQIGG